MFGFAEKKRHVPPILQPRASDGPTVSSYKRWASEECPDMFQGMGPQEFAELWKKDHRCPKCSQRAGMLVDAVIRIAIDTETLRERPVGDWEAPAASVSTCSACGHKGVFGDFRKFLEKASG